MKVLKVLKDFFTRVLSTIAMSVVVGFVYFVASDFIFPITDLNGSWIVETTTVETEYSKFQGMKLTFIALVQQEGNRLKGTGEKIAEEVNGIKQSYTGAQRVNIDFSGFVEKRYFSGDKIVLHMKERGQIRECSTIYTLSAEESDYLVGSFQTTSAMSSGTVLWRKDRQ